MAADEVRPTTIRAAAGPLRAGRTPRGRRSGFTLIELMIVVTIVGILAAIAYPAYRDQVRQSYRGTCGARLVELASQLERRFTEEQSYSGVNAGDLLAQTDCPADIATPAYSISIDSQTDTTYELHAAPQNAQTADPCGTLTLDETGAKGMDGADSGTTVAQCW